MANTLDVGKRISKSEEDLDQLNGCRLHVLFGLLLKWNVESDINIVKWYQIDNLLTKLLNPELLHNGVSVVLGIITLTKLFAAQSYRVELEKPVGSGAFMSRVDALVHYDGNRACIIELKTGSPKSSDVSRITKNRDILIKRGYDVDAYLYYACYSKPLVKI